MTDKEIELYFGMGKINDVGELIAKLTDLNSPKLPIVLNIHSGQNEIESYIGDIEYMVDIDTNGKPALFLMAESRKSFISA